MQYGIRSEQAIEKVGDLFSVVAIAGRAVEAQKHPTLAYRPLGPLSSNSDGKLSVPN